MRVEVLKDIKIETESESRTDKELNENIDGTDLEDSVTSSTYSTSFLIQPTLETCSITYFAG